MRVFIGQHWRLRWVAAWIADRAFERWLTDERCERERFAVTFAQAIDDGITTVVLIAKEIA